jgi:hypothetical protein
VKDARIGVKTGAKGAKTGARIGATKRAAAGHADIQLIC